MSFIIVPTSQMRKHKCKRLLLQAPELMCGEAGPAVWLPALTLSWESGLCPALGLKVAHFVLGIPSEEVPSHQVSAADLFHPGPQVV